MTNPVVKTPHGNFELKRSVKKIVAITVLKVTSEVSHHKVRKFPGDKIHIEHWDHVPKNRRRIAGTVYGWATPLATYTVDGELVQWEDADSAKVPL